MSDTTPPHDMRHFAPRYTARQMREVLAAFAAGASSTEAAEIVGCTPRQVLVWAHATGTVRGPRQPCPRAERAGMLIRGGMSISEAARMAGVDRRTAAKAARRTA